MVYDRDDFSPYLDAYRALLNGAPAGLRDAEQTTVFVAGPPLTDDGRKAMGWAASMRDLDVVYLEFGCRRPEKGPRRICVGKLRDGKLRWRDDCALWMGANDDTAAIVTRRTGARTRYGFDQPRIGTSCDAAVDFPTSGFAMAAARVRALARSFQETERLPLAA